MSEGKRDIDSLSYYELIKYFQENIMSIATGEDNIDESLREKYKVIREKVISLKKFEHLLPKWIKDCRNREQLFGFMKKVSGEYQGRRDFIWQEFLPLMNEIEFSNETPLDKIINFNEDALKEKWQKALDRKENDPAGAITAARALLESLFKCILDEEKITYATNSDLSELYKKVAKFLNMAPEQHQEQIFKQILGGANGIISGLGELRNKLGDAHGGTMSRVKPKQRHAEFAVNLAGSMALFIYKSYKEKI